MKLGLFAKLFLALLTVVTLIIAAMATAVHWSFRQGFADYLHQQQLERLAPLQERLTRWRSEEGGWDGLKRNQRLWRGLMAETIAGERFPPTPPSLSEQDLLPPEPLFLGRGESRNLPADPPPPEPLPPGGIDTGPMPPDGAFDRPYPPWDRGAPPPRPPRPIQHRPPPGHNFNILPRLRLLDEQGNPLIGPAKAPPNESRLPIGEGEVVLGWLGLTPAPIQTDRLAASFQAQQVNTFSLIAAFAFSLASLVAWVLARQLLIPVRRLAAGARDLTAGHYQSRIEAVGHDELGRLAADFNTLAHTLERNEQARRHWVADISHELRTPLAILRGEVEALQDGVRELSPGAIRSLHGEVLAMAKLVDDLYELALSDLGALDYRKEPLDLVEAVDEAVTAFRPRYAAAGITLVDRCADQAPVRLLADPRRLGQLLANLLENSLRYTDRGGRLEIGLRPQSDHILLDFQDSAPGVPEAALAHLFERLYRVDRSRSRRLGGAGLGLAICRNIVDAHGGDMIARHSPLGGLWIEIRLPLSG